jgi:hypothetical protein
MTTLTIYTNQHPSQCGSLLQQIANLRSLGFSPELAPLADATRTYTLQSIEQQLTEMAASRLAAEEHGLTEFWHFYHSQLKVVQTTLLATCQP